MNTRKLPYLAGGAAAVLVSAWLLSCHYELRETLVCSNCAATGVRTQWFVGAMPFGHNLLRGVGDVRGAWSLPISPGSLAVFPSVATTQLFGTSHRHTWSRTQASPLYFFGQRWGGCVLGANVSPSSPFAVAFLEDPAFRVFVERLVANHKYDRQTIAAYFVVSVRAVTSKEYRGGQGLVTQFKRERHSAG